MKPHSHSPYGTGTVYLVGAGPGDPDLLTVKAHRLLLQADVIVHDRLVSDRVLDLVPSGVVRIPVGKESGRHCVPQAQINDLLVDQARRHARVVRLKGGDPFVFGRGSEEALHLRRHGIPFEVVPGITAATACSAYAGVPLTHRGASRGVQFVTGHFRDDQPVDLDWATLANPDTTLVIYMGLAHLPLICRQLVAAGLAATTPALAVQDGTTDHQRQLTTTLAELPARVRGAGLMPPVLVVIGRTVALAEELAWFNPLPRESVDALFDRVAHA